MGNHDENFPDEIRVGKKGATELESCVIRGSTKSSFITRKKISM